MHATITKPFNLTADTDPLTPQAAGVDQLLVERRSPPGWHRHVGGPLSERERRLGADHRSTRRAHCALECSDDPMATCRVQAGSRRARDGASESERF